MEEFSKRGVNSKDHFVTQSWNTLGKADLMKYAIYGDNEKSTHTMGSWAVVPLGQLLNLRQTP